MFSVSGEVRDSLSIAQPLEGTPGGQEKGGSRSHSLFTTCFETCLMKPRLAHIPRAGIVGPAYAVFGSVNWCSLL